MHARGRTRWSRGLEVRRDLLIRLEPSEEVSVDPNFLTLGILNIDTRQRSRSIYLFYPDFSNDIPSDLHLGDANLLTVPPSTYAAVKLFIVSRPREECCEISWLWLCGSRTEYVRSAFSSERSQ